MSKEDKPDAWMPLFIGDYKKDTGRLTRDQHGGYLLLIMEYWSTGPLADDDAELGAIALASPKDWRALRPKLERFFVVEDGYWRHKRIDHELAKWTERKIKAVERARKGGEAKAKNSASSSALSTQQAVLKGYSSSSSREVDGPTGHSTLSDKISNLDLERNKKRAFEAIDFDELRERIQREAAEIAAKLEVG